MLALLSNALVHWTSIPRIVGRRIWEHGYIYLLNILWNANRG